MCDPDLEIALDMKDLHVTEVRYQILKQLILVKQQNWLKNYNTFIHKNKDTSISSRPLTKTLNASSTLVLNPEAKYIVKPSLMGLLRTECEEKDREKATFKFVPKWVILNVDGPCGHRNPPCEYKGPKSIHEEPKVAH